MATKKKPAAKKEPVQLRKPQQRILGALAKAKGPLSRKEIAEKANVDLAWIGNYTGASNTEVRKRNDKKYPSLLTLGYVKLIDADGVSTYQITAAGKKAAPGKMVVEIAI